GLGVPDPAEGIQVLERRALVAGPWLEPLVGETYSYRHALLRDAGYASLSRADRAWLHVSYARWLERVAGESWAQAAELIGRHYATALESTPALAHEVGDGVGRAGSRRSARGRRPRRGPIAARAGTRAHCRRRTAQTGAPSPAARAGDRVERGHA